MKLQNNFQPDIPSKAVSTLLEILAYEDEDRALRVYREVSVSTLLEILAERAGGVYVARRDAVSTLLEILACDRFLYLGLAFMSYSFNPS